MTQWSCFASNTELFHFSILRIGTGSPAPVSGAGGRGLLIPLCFYLSYIQPPRRWGLNATHGCSVRILMELFRQHDVEGEPSPPITPAPTL